MTTLAIKLLIAILFGLLFAPDTRADIAFVMEAKAALSSSSQKSGDTDAG